MKSNDFKELEKIVLKHFPDATWDEKTLKWNAKTKPNPKDSWDKPETLQKFDTEASKKFYSKMSGTSWDNEGNITIGVRSLFEDHTLTLSGFLNEKKPAGAPDWHDSDAPDAEGRFRDLGIKDLATWLIKTRKKDLKKISGSLTQQIVFNRKEDPDYAQKMEKVRKEVYKQLGREDLLEKIDTEGNITCDSCGWGWHISEGGKDTFICHKCGHDNTPKNNEKNNYKMKHIKMFEEFEKIDTDDLNESYDQLENYMFFSNLENIKRKCESILSRDFKTIDELLNTGGHDWAADHIATAKESIDQVESFITGEFENRSTGTEAEEKPEAGDTFEPAEPAE